MLTNLMLARLAWRNVLRNRRRSIITMVSISIGLAALTFLWGTLDGENRAMVENTTRYLASDVQVHVKGYHDDPSLDLAMAEAAPVTQAIARDPDVAASAVRLEGKALASRGDKARGVLMMGVSPQEEGRVTSLFKAIVAGTSLRPTDSTGALVGVKLAESLGASVGDELVLVGQAYDGSLSSARVPVRGIFRTNIDQYDGYVAVMPLGAVREFLAAPNGATSIALRLQDRGQLGVVAPRLQATLGQRYEVVGWPTLLPLVVTSVRFHEVMGYLIVTIFFAIVAAGVANPVLMSVLERTREFGVMLAVGMSPSRLLRLVLWEALLLGALGVLVGNVIGLGTTLYFGHAGIDLTAFQAGLSIMQGASDVLRPVARAQRSLAMSAIVFAIACLVALYPAAKAARLNPVNAIRGLAGRPGGSQRRLFRRSAPQAESVRWRWPVFVLIATRNILRNPRRTAITAGGAALAILGYIALVTFFDGFTEQIVDTSTRYLTGHVQIERAGFRKDFAPELTLGSPDELLARLRRTPHVAGAAPRVQAQAIASSAAKSEGVALIGIDPTLERSVTFIDRTIVQGTALRAGRDRDIMIGRKLAEKLNVRLDEKIVITTQAAGGELGTAAYRVSGIFATESASFDEGMAFVTLPAAQALLGLQGRVSTVNIRLDDRSQVADAVAHLRPWVSTSGYSVAPWQELLPQVVDMIRFIGAIRVIIMAIILVVVAIAIMNTVFMSVAERTREFGVMMALGTRPSAILRMVLYETTAIMVLASVVGYAASELVAGYFGRNGLDLSGFFRNYDAIPGITGMVYPRLVVASIVGPGIALFVASVLVSLYPAANATRLDPATAIRHT
jgi:ABC-type lipoprotein release transport system permease subunit